MSDATILCEVDGDGVATVTINRPERMNALDDATVLLLRERMEAAGNDPAVRVVVLTGAGRAFCAGGDVGTFGGTTPQDLITKLPRLFDQNRRADYQTRHIYFPAIPKPVIAMINGPVVGMGLLYALACDVRFAADDATFTTGFAKLGLAGEYGISWLLPHIVGHAHALDLLLSSRKLRGDEVRAIGLANFVVPAADLAARTYDYARAMATGCSPQSLRIMKRQLWDVPFQTLAEALIVANQDMLATNDSADFSEGTAVFREKRAPRFAPLPASAH